MAETLIQCLSEKIKRAKYFERYSPLDIFSILFSYQSKQCNVLTSWRESKVVGLQVVEKIMFSNFNMLTKYSFLTGIRTQLM